MSFHFYLSYAPADFCEDLQKFFDDLSCAVRARLPQFEDEQVGFLDPRGTAASDWTPEVSEALRTSQTMVALLSPEYFSSERSGKDWRIFERRKHLGARTGSIEGQEVIAPMIWIPCDHSMAKAARDYYVGLSHLTSAFPQNGLLRLRRSVDRFRAEYVKMIVSLAGQIIEMARTAKLRPLDVVPPFEQADNAFNFSWESSVSSTDPTENKKFKVILVERHEQVRKMLIEYLELSDFSERLQGGRTDTPSHIES